MEPVSRRATLATGVGLVAAAVTGCGDVVASGSSASPDPDLRLVREALRRELRVRERVRQLHGAPRSRTALAGVASVHQDHLALLRRAVTGDGEAGTPVQPHHPSAMPAQQLRRLAVAERQLADAHADAALEAQSGPLARLLAGLAAAADQQAHVLDGLAAEVSRG